MNTFQQMKCDWLIISELCDRWLCSPAYISRSQPYIHIWEWNNGNASTPVGGVEAFPLFIICFIYLFFAHLCQRPLESITSSNRVESSLCHFQASRGCFPPLLTTKNSLLCFYLHCWLFFFFTIEKHFCLSSLNSVYKSQLHLSLYRRVNIKLNGNKQYVYDINVCCNS